MAVRDGVIAWLGSDDVGRAQFPDAHTVDLDGAFVAPAFVDSHVHLTFSGSADPVGDYVAATDVDLAVRAYHNCMVSLARGVTTVADCGARGDGCVHGRHR